VKEVTLRELREVTGLVLIDFFSPGCGVCTAIETKLVAVEKDFPSWKFFKINTVENPAVASEYSVFTNDCSANGRKRAEKVEQVLLSGRNNRISPRNRRNRGIAFESQSADAGHSQFAWPVSPSARPVPLRGPQDPLIAVKSCSWIRLSEKM